MPSSTREVVSLIVPVYNGARFLPQTLESIQRQTYRQWELIAIDDASQDQSWAMLQAVQDPRIRRVRHRHHRGIPATRNTGLRLARGAFITFCDQDDLLPPRSLADRVAYLRRRPGARSVFGRMVCGQTRGDRFVKIPIPAMERQYHLYRRVGCLPRQLLTDETAFPGALTAHLLRRDLVEAVGPLNVRWQLVDDWEYAARVASILEPRFLDRPVVWHRFHEENAAIAWRNGQLWHAPRYLAEVQRLRRHLRRAAR